MDIISFIKRLDQIEEWKNDITIFEREYEKKIKYSKSLQELKELLNEADIIINFIKKSFYNKSKVEYVHDSLRLEACHKCYSLFMSSVTYSNSIIIFGYNYKYELNTIQESFIVVNKLCSDYWDVDPYFNLLLKNIKHVKKVDTVMQEIKIEYKSVVNNFNKNLVKYYETLINIINYHFNSVIPISKSSTELDILKQEFDEIYEICSKSLIRINEYTKLINKLYYDISQKIYNQYKTTKELPPPNYSDLTDSLKDNIN
jgi:hypothetical protein